MSSRRALMRGGGSTVTETGGAAMLALKDIRTEISTMRMAGSLREKNHKATVRKIKKAAAGPGCPLIANSLST
ncbi:hypothetical protein AOQ73_09255 [Bradyrhizobium pachyrhizi]|nr:hypothetical protein AOQ73_09255 [Bradyrhizobium pachyrhizi]